MRPILQFGSPALETKAKKVTVFDDDLRTLVYEMLAVMRHAHGVGLAAPQIGVSKAVFVLERKHTGGPTFFVNPEIVERSKEIQRGAEGCLSANGFFYPTPRPKRVVVRFQGLAGGFTEWRAEGLAARAVCHECDHLKGQLFFTRKRPDQKVVIQAFRAWQKSEDGVELARADSGGES